MRFEFGETPGVFGLSQGKRESTAHSIVAFTVSSGHLRLSKLPSDFRRLRGLLAATRFNGRRFARNGRNAYIRRSALSGLRFCLLSHYVMERRPLSLCTRESLLGSAVPPPSLFAQGSQMCREVRPRLHASPYGKRRCHESDGGDKKIEK